MQTCRGQHFPAAAAFIGDHRLLTALQASRNNVLNARVHTFAPVRRSSSLSKDLSTGQKPVVNGYDGARGRSASAATAC
eukprot:278096-Pleurochrysis_carterae.AAC.1